MSNEYGGSNFANGGDNADVKDDDQNQGDSRDIQNERSDPMQTGDDDSRRGRDQSVGHGGSNSGGGGGGRRNRENENQVRSLFVRGLSEGTRPVDLMEAFQCYGTVTDCYLPMDFYTGKARGFAYIQFETQEQADKAFARIEYITINGRTLTIEWAAGKRKTPGEMRNPIAVAAGRPVVITLQTSTGLGTVATAAALERLLVTADVPALGRAPAAVPLTVGSAARDVDPDPALVPDPPLLAAPAVEAETLAPPPRPLVADEVFFLSQCPFYTTAVLRAVVLLQ
ncbi:Serine/arginine-rich splicing factor 12 [Thoreauomyces humboldtii]|nr:Serine/arginine-rich splicing factor 12 [Thoreauomyces humboldtii]